MDALAQSASEAARDLETLPPEAPLAMPQQSLWGPRPRADAPATGVPLIRLRRLFVFAAAISLTGVAAYEMYEVLQVGGMTVLEQLVLALFILLFAWIALSFVSAIVGFVALLFVRGGKLGIDSNELPSLRSRTALLLPTYNENPHRVMARMQAIYESVRKTGRLPDFDFFILSDTSDPAVWIAEEAAFLRLRAATGDKPLYYRHRADNSGRKAGNIGEWVRRFGGAYDHMIVLDADSLMEGETIVRLTGAMERNARVGLIQTFPLLLNGNTLFARLQQFAGRIYGPLIAQGVAWWHGAESNYWGHNAIIRVRAFAGEAGLPTLRGRKPFGGHVLSHDFVEAALMRRAGWAIHLLPELGGSYEECPPTLADYLTRDRRWCQGNLQHAAILPARGLHWVSRLHLLTGIGAYVTAPLWLIFLLVGILISLQARFIPPDYFPHHASLFPQWPMQDPIRSAYVFAGTMAMLLVPKFLGWIAAVVRRKERRAIGGTLRALGSTIVEIVISALIAPVMMLMQSRSVAEIMLGRDAGWSAQQRGDGSFSRTGFVRRYISPTVLGFVLGAGAYSVSTPLLVWMLPVVAGLVLTIPVGWLTAIPSVGRGFRAAGLLLTPEERTTPRILQRANELADEYKSIPIREPFACLISDPGLYSAHLKMLQAPAPKAKGDVNVNLVVGLAKIAQTENREEATALLDAAETFAVLSDTSALKTLLGKGQPHRMRSA
ncbi:MAG TPA: glucans biosynthesis glucosyltransferase MdoH [Pseudolabrys sp.]|nr:glucans biosynthesis glucosyltransferase MdoH [Pseudolabrys sp.]